MKCIFHAVSPYQLLEMLTLRLHSYPDVYGCAVVYFLEPKKVEKLKCFFDQVIVLKNLFSYTRSGELSESCLLYYDSVFSTPELDLSSFDEIFVGGAHFPFAQYLISRKIPFSFFEDAAGLLFEPEVMESNNYSAYNGQGAYLFCKKNGLYDGWCPLITKRFCDMSAQTKPRPEGMENIQHFSVVDALGELSAKDREKIIRFYLDDYPIQVPKNSVLIFTEHLAHLKIMTLDEQCLLYQLLLDYFFPGRKIVFKPHPSSMMLLDDMFPDSAIIREVFPSELIPFVFSSKPEVAATIYSRAVCTLSRHFEKTFVLTHEFELNGEFHNIHRYSAALDVIRKLGDNPQTIHQLGADVVLLERLTDGEVLFPAFAPAEDWKYLIVGRPEAGAAPESIGAFLDSLPDDRVVVFLNLDDAYPFYEIGQASPWEHLVPLELQKEQRRADEFYSDCEPETIWLYTKNKQLKETAEEFTMEKELKNAGLAVKMANLTPDQMRIKVLEGIVAAMEVRMHSLIEENTKLKSQIKESRS